MAEFYRVARVSNDNIDNILWTLWGTLTDFCLSLVVLSKDH